ncbi:type I restriction-modification system subunit M N-terminal domain-containing protein, partial [Thiolapillus sp.]|uniref:type I restriction-modification system subunit M N-terminal domain-containing protein n=2 Tax=Thiolapillus sp. TaxID=2017437 RepID=UPI003AF70AF9
MTQQDRIQLGKTLWAIADDLRGSMNADDFRDYMLAFLFLRYLSDNYEEAAQKELGPDWPAQQACLRPRDRFWDIPVPKINSAFDNLFVPQPSWSPSTTQQL